MNKKRKNPTIEQTELYDRITRIQTEIIDRVTQLKKQKEKPSIGCKHFENLPPCEQYEPSANYYQKFWKCFLLNQLCYARLQQTEKSMNQIQSQITQKLFRDHEKLTEGKGVKRKRRQAIDIDKQFSCPYPRCFKNYGAEIALNLHIKQKHNGGNKTQREHAAEMIWQAQQNNLPTPMIYINLPPGYLEEYLRNRTRVDYLANRLEEQIYQERQ